jgi:flavin-dependent dehydrogenase
VIPPARGSQGEAKTVRAGEQPVGEGWAAMIVGDAVGHPSPGEVKGMAFSADTAVEAEYLAKTHLGMAEPAN